MSVGLDSLDVFGCLDCLTVSARSCFPQASLTANFRSGTASEAALMPRKQKSPAVSNVPLGAPPVVKLTSPRSIAKPHKPERFACAIHAPSPSCLPKPPSSWTRPAPPMLKPAQLTSPITPPITLQRSDVVQKQVRLPGFVVLSAPHSTARSHRLHSSKATSSSRCSSRGGRSSPERSRACYSSLTPTSAMSSSACLTCGSGG